METELVKAIADGLKALDDKATSILSVAQANSQQLGEIEEFQHNHLYPALSDGGKEQSDTALVQASESFAGFAKELQDLKIQVSKVAQAIRVPSHGERFVAEAVNKNPAALQIIQQLPQEAANALLAAFAATYDQKAGDNVVYLPGSEGINDAS